MRVLCSLALALIPWTVGAAADCEIIEYPDHYEAVCLGGAREGPATPTAAPPPLHKEATAVASAAQQAEGPDMPAEQVVRNDLARLHGAHLLKSNGR